jgi:hypothetical protein
LSQQFQKLSVSGWTLARAGHDRFFYHSRLRQPSLERSHNQLKD